MNIDEADKEIDSQAIAEAEQAALNEWNKRPTAEREALLQLARTVWQSTVELETATAIASPIVSELKRFRERYISLVESLSDEARGSLDFTALYTSNLPMAKPVPPDEVMGVHQPISFLHTIDETIEVLPSAQRGPKPTARDSGVSTAAIRAVAEQLELRSYGTGSSRTMAPDERLLFSICKQIDVRVTAPNVRHALKNLTSRKLSPK
ncbi:hypothetical protein IQ22_03842 [Pseudomonas duriflava]|uniref:Uncharacterized protein n=1 Tax=Pseudomonas duriflava TaxID=459528 RepID=A0A562Q1A4_9PSED|nr:hypothetical protein [Pseudomonas duriflava]TWI50452.1 hypothetical protein IQ22_03842 [Pseudomonas duriflava]